jgi:hypothetical protein
MNQFTRMSRALLLAATILSLLGLGYDLSEPGLLSAGEPMEDAPATTYGLRTAQSGQPVVPGGVYQPLRWAENNASPDLNVETAAQAPTTYGAAPVSAGMYPRVGAQYNEPIYVDDQRSQYKSSLSPYTIAPTATPSTRPVQAAATVAAPQASTVPAATVYAPQASTVPAATVYAPQTSTVPAAQVLVIAKPAQASTPPPCVDPAPVVASGGITILSVPGDNNPKEPDDGWTNGMVATSPKEPSDGRNAVTGASNQEPSSDGWKAVTVAPSLPKPVETAQSPAPKAAEVSTAGNAKNINAKDQAIVPVAAQMASKTPTAASKGNGDRHDQKTAASPPALPSPGLLRLKDEDCVADLPAPTPPATSDRKPVSQAVDQAASVTTSLPVSSTPFIVAALILAGGVGLPLLILVRRQSVILPGETIQLLNQALRMLGNGQLGIRPLTPQIIRVSVPNNSAQPSGGGTDASGRDELIRNIIADNLNLRATENETASNDGEKASSGESEAADVPAFAG